MNEKLLNEMTANLGDNRGLAKTAINVCESILVGQTDGLDGYTDDELLDYFWDLVCDEDCNGRNEDARYLLDILCALNRQCGLRSNSYGYLADLMLVYYKNL